MSLRAEGMSMTLIAKKTDCNAASPVVLSQDDLGKRSEAGPPTLA